MFAALLTALMFLGVAAQHFLGEMPGFGGRVLLLPVIFFYAAAALPLWQMLAVAFAAGFMWDALTLPWVDGQVQIVFGWTILLYGALGAVMNGLRPLFIRGRWQWHCVLTGALTSLVVLIEYVMITLRREPLQLIFPKDVWMRIAGSGLAALLLAPIFFFALNWIGRRLGYFEQARLEERI